MPLTSDTGWIRGKRKKGTEGKNDKKKRSSLQDNRKMRTTMMYQTDGCALDLMGQIDHMTCIFHYTHFYFSLSLSLVTRHSSPGIFAILRDCSLDMFVFFSSPSCCAVFHFSLIVLLRASLSLFKQNRVFHRHFVKLLCITIIVLV